MIKKNILLGFYLFCAMWAIAQPYSRQEYIQEFGPIAIQEMQSYGIPASITMAQGILESNNGNSMLATEANNHFGIKCHDWSGPSVKKDDDAKNECFRKYNNALHSFEDHSKFLTTRDRYAFLFDYDATDYKAWAKGLKKAGYATNPKYPALLIKIIEENKLFLLDQQAIASLNSDTYTAKDEVRAIADKETSLPDHATVTKADKPIQQLEKSVIYTSESGAHFILAKKTLSPENIAQRYNIKLWEVFRNNDIEKDKSFMFSIGQRIYIEKKRRKSPRGTAPHRVRAGETMHDIAQEYGIRLKSLYRLNRMYRGMEPQAGQVIYLSKKKPKK